MANTVSHKLVLTEVVFEGAVYLKKNRMIQRKMTVRTKNTMKMISKMTRRKKKWVCLVYRLNLALSVTNVSPHRKVSWSIFHLIQVNQVTEFKHH